MTLPMMKESILSVLVLGFVGTFKVFDLVYVMTGGGPVNATEVLSTYSYENLLNLSTLVRAQRPLIFFFSVCLW